MNSNQTHKVGDTVIVLYSTITRGSITGWPIFVEFEITELRTGGYIGIRTKPHILQPHEHGLSFTGITEPISNSQIVPPWLKEAVVHSWNEFYGHNNKETAKIFYRIGNFIRQSKNSKERNSEQNHCKGRCDIFERPDST